MSLEIDEIRVENCIGECITDNTSPVVAFSLQSDEPDTNMTKARVTIGGYQKVVQTQTGIRCKDVIAKPFAEYTVQIEVKDNHGRKAEKSRNFYAGRLDTPWDAKWITDGSYEFRKKESPLPMTFRKRFLCKAQIKRAYITATALGVYELILNGEKVGREYFAPGYTSYKKNLQYQLYDVTGQLREKNELLAVVGGGWAVGRFTYNSLTRITAEKQALLLELFVEYENGQTEKIVTDLSWNVTEEGNYRFGDFYDGEIYDATVDLNRVAWRRASVFRAPVSPEIKASYGCPVTVQETLAPVETFPGKNGEMIYDFGQNFAGVVSLQIEGKKGQEIRIRHAESIFDGDICVNSMRTAKATAVYICREGRQSYSPRLTYMGFRYIGISGIEPEKLQVFALVLHSEFEETGTFACSDPMLNRLQSNIRWSGKSNFLEVPTDCPQRDERLGWTGDISLFAPTACYNFDLSRFFEKWLADVRAEQTRGGGIPFVIPKAGNLGPSVPTACWGDCCILVPWAEYRARGDKTLLIRSYPMMKKYLRSVKHWASLFSVRKDQRRIWKLLFQFGDWNAPGKSPKECMAKGPWVATAYFAHTSDIMSQIATILGKEKDRREFAGLRDEIIRAYRNVFTDGKGKLEEEFQTGYVLPLYFGMAEGEEAKRMADRLDELVKKNGFHLSTGFTGTPYLLFALADHGHADTAFRLLYQDTCPSWLYEIKNGGTTFWEEWGIVPEGTENENGKHCVSDSGVSFNHYAYGAVGDFLYRRVLGLEAEEAGYRRFRIKPLQASGLASAKGSVKTPYGRIYAEWKMTDGVMCVSVDVPVSTECTVYLPNGKCVTVTSGSHVIAE